MDRPQEIITFSHLRWDFVYQRPQHLLSRMAARRRVFFVEEPVFDDAPPHWERLRPEPNVTVLRPHTPEKTTGFSDPQLALMRALLTEFVEAEELTDYILWFYTPMALPLAENLKPRSVVYDSMDELSAFLNAPPQLLEREEQLFQLADVVFTGGPSLYRAKKDRHRNVHCFPSSVDVKHFGRARRGGTEAPEQRSLPHPRLGFFGVIDERLDAPLLKALADAHPDWSIAMVGPVVKIDPEMLPRNSNIRYFGQRGYDELPSFLAGWDVCLLPFARNEATRFISPTKTLEYMAAERPIVSTPITDVAEPYGDIVYLGGTPDEFIRACELALESSKAERRERVSKMREVLSRTSWDATTEAMDALIVKAGEKGRQGSGRVSHSSVSSRPTVVIGAGPTGLSATYHLGDDSLLIEQNDRVGGWCRSVEQNGFTFDYAGHIMFYNDAYVHQMYKMLLGDNVHWQDREAWIYSKGVYTRYPFQGALYGLPPAVIKECIIGAIEARFGPINKKQHGTNGKGKSNGHEGAQCRTGVNDCCADGILESTARLTELQKDEPRNFEEFIYKVWGAGIARHFALPYNRKLWAVPLSEMETSWLGGRVPLPDLEEMIEGALQPVPKPMGPNARFGYPLRGGFQALMNGFLPYISKRLRLKTRVTAVSPRWRTVFLSDGTEVPYDHLVNTMPLPVLVRLMGDEAPGEVRKAAAGLRHVSVRCVNIGVGRENLTDKHWIYYPEDTVFHRIFVQGNASPHCNAPGGFGLTCEITYSAHKPLPADGQALIDLCVRDCHRVGFFSPNDPVVASNQVDLPYAYVVYDHNRKRNVQVIREWLTGQGIILAGRYSEWEYYNSDHAFIAGKKAAEQVRELQRKRADLGGEAAMHAGGRFAFEDLA
jgi:UDP-galactopyranose mutase